MSRSPSRLVPFVFLIIAVWVVVFWMWKPHTGAITRDATGVGAFDKPADLASETAPPPAAATHLDPPPAPAAPIPAAPLTPLRLGDRFGDRGGAPAGTPRVIPPQFDEYTLIAGDTSFAVISKRLFDTTKYADAIAASNPYASPDRLKPGATIRIPRDPTNIQGKVEPGVAGIPAAPDPAGSEMHTVESGETLSGISKQHYGTATLWKRILEANHDTLPSPDRLKPGMKLVIPPKD